MRNSQHDRKTKATSRFIRFIRLISFLVPPSRRREWRQEWEAEILHHSDRRAKWGKRPLFSSPAHYLGALPDALLVSLQHFGDGTLRDIRFALRMLLSAPAFT